MAKKHKVRIIDRDPNGTPMLGHCTACGRAFKFENTPDGRKLEEAAETSECKREDASQAAARIVREATEG